MVENKGICGTLCFWVFLYHRLTLRSWKRSPNCKTTLKIFWYFSKILELTQKVYVKWFTLTLWLRVLSQKWTARTEVHLQFWKRTAGRCYQSWCSIKSTQSSLKDSITKFTFESYIWIQKQSQRELKKGAPQEMEELPIISSSAW